MANITLRSGEKIWVQCARMDSTIDDLARILCQGHTQQSVEVIRTLSLMGSMAVEILPTLDALLLSTAANTPYYKEIFNLIEVIKPREKEVPKKKEEKIDVEIKTGSLEAGAQVFKKCNFCEKETLVLDDLYRDKLCPPGRFYCRFCLRHCYNNRDNRHFLMFTMRSVLGYYFWQFYYGPSRPMMWLSEIKDYINLHEEIGLRNPIFNYDPETYIWFVDFRRVGDSKKKLPLVEVKRTVVEMLAVFNLHINVKGLSMSAFYEKYSEAINEFYQKRHRPEGKKLLSPTFKGCGNPEWGQYGHNNQLLPPVHAGNKLNIEETRNFSPTLLYEHLWNKTGV